MFVEKITLLIKVKSECWDGQLLSEKELEYIDSISMI